VRACDLVRPWPAKAVCFTFDDAYASTMHHAPSILEEGQAFGSFYAVTDKVGLTSDWDGAEARPLASWEALVQAQARGHEIGNHTRSHVQLARLEWLAQVAEITDATRALKDHGLNAASFCFPYGSLCSPDVLTEAGYNIGLALKKRVATENDDPRLLPRVVVAYSDVLPMLLYKIYIRPRLRRASPN
jgi:peptidoglycan/xylan/chitin deacetylase (PgdA/CDA1 family)